MKPGRQPFCRIAFRSEGEFVNAYYAAPSTMDDAILIASVRKTALQKTPGAFEDYQALVRKVLQQGFDDIGVQTDGWVTGPAPEHERTGRA